MVVSMLKIIVNKARDTESIRMIRKNIIIPVLQKYLDKICKVDLRGKI